jgi:tetratricopeptide (TPR) repeat protein
VLNQLFLSYQTIFGNSTSVSYDRTNLVLPLKSQKLYAKCLLDSIPNKTVRGGKQPIICIFLLPINISEESLMSYNDLQSKILNKFIETKTIAMINYYNDALELTYSLSIKTHEQASTLFKNKNYSKSLDFFKYAINMTIVSNKPELTENYRRDLGKSVVKTIEDLLNTGNKQLKTKILDEAEKSFKKSQEIGEEFVMQSLIKKSMKALQQVYIQQTLDWQTKARSALKESNYKLAIKNYEKAVKCADKSLKPGLSKKIIKEMSKIPNS